MMLKIWVYRLNVIRPYYFSHCIISIVCRGDLWQSWEAGARVFDEFLLDADWALNHANWQWLSASNFFYQVRV